MFSLSQAQVGQTVRFHYDGGSEVGFRLVKVNSKEASSIRGTDLEKKLPRQYSFHKVNSVSVVAEPGESVVFPGDFLAAPSGKIPGETLVNIYRQLNPEVLSARHVSSINALVVRPKTPPTIIVEFDGKKLNVTFASSAGAGITCQSTEVADVPSPEPFAIRINLTDATAAQVAKRVGELFADAPEATPPPPPTPPAPSKSPWMDDVQANLLSGGFSR